MKAALGLAFLVATASTASAEPVPRWSITGNLGYLILPVVSVSVERPLWPRLSVSARAGVGRVAIDAPFVDDEVNTVVEIGGAGRYYVLGDAGHGLALGLDARFIDAGTGALTEVESGGAIGPFAGYKYVHGSGLTADIRLGAQRAFGDADESVVPLIFVGGGWSL